MNTELMITIGTLLAQALGVIVAVDFVSGVLHWLEDAYGRKTWPIVGKLIIEPNIKHHFEPRYFTKSNVLKRNTMTSLLAGMLLLAVWLLGWFHWTWALAALIGAFTNEIHCWAHRSPRENGKMITALQKARLLQSPRGHAIHHTDPKDRSYCTVTDWLNPLLDRVNFFGKIEALLFHIFGWTRRVDESVRLIKKGKNRLDCEGCS